MRIFYHFLVSRLGINSRAYGITYSNLFKCNLESESGDTMDAYVVGIGILLVIIGIVALIVPALAKIISAPGNEKIKAIAVIIAGIVVIVCGYILKI